MDDADEAAARPAAVRWVRVATFMREAEAHLLAGRLKAEGIDARVDRPRLPFYYGAAVAALLEQGIDVHVREEQERDARTVIEEVERG